MAGGVHRSGQTGYTPAGHALLGGVELIDKDGIEITSGYTLNLAHDFEGKGAIATATFAAGATGHGAHQRAGPGQAG